MIRLKAIGNAYNVPARLLFSIGVGLWSQDARRHYQTLCASQILKSHVLRDTLAICNWASGAFGLRARDTSTERASDRRAHLLLLRSAVLRRLRDQVARLGDLQAQFERTLDLQLQDHPRPFLGRRREQGMYTSFLADRCFDIYTDVDDLLTTFSEGRHPVDTTRAGRFSHTNLTPLAMHRWQHSFTSSCKRVPDNVEDVPGMRSSQTTIHFINTSYWIPDRPDLQVIIAHEIAHNLIEENYGGLDAENLAMYRDTFAKLIRLLSHCMEQAGLSRTNPTGPVRSYPDLTLREVASDLLAVHVRLRVSFCTLPGDHRYRTGRALFGSV